MPRINPTAHQPNNQQQSPSTRVRSGDTLTGIASRHGVSLDDLLAVNPQIQNPNRIRVGQQVFLPAGGVQPANDSPNDQSSNRTYTVRSRDNLHHIASRHGCSVDALLSANPQISNPSLIRPGQVLNLPQSAQADRMANAWSDAGASGNRWREFNGINDGRVLRRGQAGDDVRRLQEALVATGHMSRRDAATGPGIFGPITQSSVRRFQADHGLTVDGVVGPQTRAALGRALGRGRPPTAEAVSPQPRGERPSVHRPQAGTYDGTSAAPGTTNTRAWIPVDAPLQNQPGQRDPHRYDQVLNQFGVGSNPRYRPRGGNTYCNIFVWDATRAMGAEIPHWVDQRGRPAGVGAAGAWEMDANDTNRWLNNQGAASGWRKVSASEAQRHANTGSPAVVSWKNPGGIGHIGMVRPGEITSAGPAMAQAGSRNFNSGHVADGFGRRRVEYWIHD